MADHSASLCTWTGWVGRGGSGGSAWPRSRRQFDPLDNTADEDIDEQFLVNFRAHWTAMTAEAALMRRGGSGAIVNTSSIGSRRANAAVPAYGAMKRALNSVTETAAVSWARDGIRVNAITPGGTATETIAALQAASPAMVERVTASIPLGRMAEPSEIAEAAAGLLTDRASYVTGAVVPVDSAAARRATVNVRKTTSC